MPGAEVVRAEVRVAPAGGAAVAAHELAEDRRRRDAAHEVDAEVAVKRRGDVVVAHRPRDADGGRLVAAPGVVAPGQLPGLEEQVPALLDEPRGEHVAVEADEVLAVEAQLARLGLAHERAGPAHGRHAARIPALPD